MQEECERVVRGHPEVTPDGLAVERTERLTLVEDETAQSAADAKWQQNAVAIADFLSKANSNWPRAVLVDLMKKHLATTKNEVVARLSKNWDQDVRAYDAVYDHVLMMSDAISDGIIKQFPNRFGPGADATATSGRK